MQNAFHSRIPCLKKGISTSLIHMFVIFTYLMTLACALHSSQSFHRSTFIVPHVLEIAERAERTTSLRIGVKYIYIYVECDEILTGK